MVRRTGFVGLEAGQHLLFVDLRDGVDGGGGEQKSGGGVHRRPAAMMRRRRPFAVWDRVGGNTIAWSWRARVGLAAVEVARRGVRAFNTTGNQNPNFVPGTPGIGTPA